MKIYTITYSFAQNCGAMLQAYALKEFLALQGYDVQVIDYRDFDKRLFLMPSTFKGFIKTLPCIAGDICRIGKHYRRVNRYQNFRRQYLNLTAKCRGEEALKKLNAYADVFIAGSDQIWNVGNGVCKDFYLEFVQGKGKRISYAASFGVTEIPEEFREETAAGIRYIEYLSVRERTGQEIVRALTGREAKLVVDPVFLLDKSEWDRIAGDRIEKRPYIFVYYEHMESMAAARQIQSKTGLPVLSNIIDMGPLEFINYIKYAEYVVCDSFHALAFSIIFEKKFWSVDDSGRGKRSRNLLELASAGQYCICNAADFVWEDENRNFVEMKKKIEGWISGSRKFLVGSIEDGE